MGLEKILLDAGKLIKMDNFGNIMLENPSRYLYGWLDEQTKELPFDNGKVIISGRDIANVRLGVNGISKTTTRL